MHRHCIRHLPTWRASGPGLLAGSSQTASNLGGPAALGDAWLRPHVRANPQPKQTVCQLGQVLGLGERALLCSSANCARTCLRLRARDGSAFSTSKPGATCSRSHGHAARSATGRDSRNPSSVRYVGGALVVYHKWRRCVPVSARVVIFDRRRRVPSRRSAADLVHETVFSSCCNHPHRATATGTCRRFGWHIFWPPSTVRYSMMYACSSSAICAWDARPSSAAWSSCFRGAVGSKSSSRWIESDCAITSSAPRRLCTLKFCHDHTPLLRWSNTPRPSFPLGSASIVSFRQGCVNPTAAER